MACGKYRGRVVVDVLARKTKLMKKKADAKKAKTGTASEPKEKAEKTEKKTSKEK
jgi:hypothetical protein